MEIENGNSIIYVSKCFCNKFLMGLLCGQKLVKIHIIIIYGVNYVLYVVKITKSGIPLWSLTTIECRIS